MFRRTSLISLVMIVSLLFVACGNANKTSGTPENSVTPEITAAESVEPAPEATPEPETAPTPKPGYSTTQTIYPIEKGDGIRHPITENDTGYTLIQAVANKSAYNTSFMIASKTGKIIVMDPSSMPFQKLLPLVPDIVTVTHAHQDHFDANFVRVAEKNGSKIMNSFAIGDITLEDIHVYSLYSDHNGDNISSESPTNLIYVYEVDGLRIAYLGDIGQSKLIDEQLKAMGTIDILLTQLDNSFSNLSYKRDEKAKTIIKQLNPKIIITTHSLPEYDKDLATYLGAEYEMVDTILAVDASKLKDEKNRVVFISQLQKYE